MKVYTKGGDKGRTAVIGRRVDKDDIRIEANGVIDQANCYIGLIRVKLSTDHPWQAPLKQIQIDLMNMMGHIAKPSDVDKELRIPKPTEGAKQCEEWIDALEKNLSTPSDYFTLPGGNELSVACHLARTEIRNAERRLVSLHKVDPVEKWIFEYVNRLSDLFFTLSRAALDEAKIDEDRWELFIYKP